MFSDHQTNIKAGINVALISVPIAISLAIVGGATPMMGLLSGARSGVLAAIFCSSKHNAYGPAGSLAGILLPITIAYGVSFLPLLAVISGLFILIFGTLRLTKYLTLIPGAALQGFLLGIGLIIGLEQIPALLGVSLEYSAREALIHIHHSNPRAIAVCILTILILHYSRKYNSKIPGAIIVTLVGVIIGKYTAQAADIDLLLLMNQYTDVSFSLFVGVDRHNYRQALSNTDTLKTMLTAGIGVGVIALLETLISAKIAMKETRVSYDPQREVYGLGITNILTGLVGGIPVSALVPRTNVNIQSGATTKLSGFLIGAFTAIFSAFFFTSALQFLPFAVVAGILIDIARGMINLSLYHKLRSIEKISIAIVLLVGFISYVRDPMVGILIGTVIALLVVVKRAMASDLMANIFRDGKHHHKLPLSQYHEHQQAGDLLLIKLEGELNYLTIESHRDMMQRITQADTIILGFGYTALIDFDAQEELEHLIAKRLTNGKQVYITGLSGQSLDVMKTGSAYHQLHQTGHIHESKSALLDQLLQ